MFHSLNAGGGGALQRHGDSGVPAAPAGRGGGSLASGRGARAAAGSYVRAYGHGAAAAPVVGCHCSAILLVIYCRCTTIDMLALLKFNYSLFVGEACPVDCPLCVSHCSLLFVAPCRS